MNKKIILFLILTCILVSSFLSYAAPPKVKDFFKHEVKRGSVTIQTEGSKVVIIIPYKFGEMPPSFKTKKILQKVYKYIKYFTGYKIVIEGHTDDIKPRKPNTIKHYPDLKRYSEGRAKGAKNYLVSLGLNGQYIKTEGHGASKPRATNSTSAGRAKNRRIEINLELSLGNINVTRPNPPGDENPPETTLRARQSN